MKTIVQTFWMQRKTNVQTFWAQSKTLVQTFWVQSKTFVKKSSHPNYNFVQHFVCEARLLCKILDGSSNLWGAKKDFCSKSLDAKEDFCSNILGAKFKHFGCKARILFKHFGCKARLLFKGFGCNTGCCSRFHKWRCFFLDPLPSREKKFPLALIGQFLLRVLIGLELRHRTSIQQVITN